MKNFSDEIIDPVNLQKEIKQINKFMIVICLIGILYSTLLATGLYFAYEYQLKQYISDIIFPRCKDI